MQLIPFTKSHYQILINWVKEPETHFKFAGIGFKYPLNEEQLDEYLVENADRKAFLALDEDLNPIAFGEIIPQGEGSARLGHLIIGESQNRGKGVGQQFIKALNQEAKLLLQTKNMDLFVIEGNMPAINCYLKSGFNFIPNDFAITYEGKSFLILKMTLPL
jgi:GNAT superfamily N-acetyltransferase